MSQRAKSAKDRTLILHIGLHKTATSYLQNVLSTRRYDLLDEGVLYPMTGSADVSFRTREGAQSGHVLLTRLRDASEHRVRAPERDPRHRIDSALVIGGLHAPTSKRGGQYISRFSAFGNVQVVLVLRRQDIWIESYYKQIVDQYGKFETRSFDEFLEQMGPKLLDFHTRFLPWRDLVGPESFHVLSYDDLAGGAAICRRILEIAGVRSSLLDNLESTPVPRYESVRAIDTLGLRILNAYRLADRDTADPDRQVDLRRSSGRRHRVDDGGDARRNPGALRSDQRTDRDESGSRRPCPASVLALRSLTRQPTRRPARRWWTTSTR